MVVQTSLQAMAVMRFMLLIVLLRVTNAFLSPGLASSPLRSHTECNMAVSDVEDLATGSMCRRSLFGSVAASALWYQGIQAAAAESVKLETLEVSDYNFQMLVPSTWDKSEQTLQDRRKVTFFIDPASNKKTLLFLAYTPIRDDFTSLSSFGTVEQVGQTTILPKGELAGTDNSSNMIKAESKKNAYFFDYTANVPGQPETHYRTIFALSPVKGSAGSVLVTITAQTPETNYTTLKGTFDSMMDSYGKLG